MNNRCKTYLQVSTIHKQKKQAWGDGTTKTFKYFATFVLVLFVSLSNASVFDTCESLLHLCPKISTLPLVPHHSQHNYYKPHCHIVNLCHASGVKCVLVAEGVNKTFSFNKMCTLDYHNMSHTTKIAKAFNLSTMKETCLKFLDFRFRSNLISQNKVVR